MTRRWPGRSAVLAIAIASTLLVVAAAGAVGRDAQRSLVVSLPDGTEVARLALPDDGSFGLRYRNSLYGTLAEERFTVTASNELRLVRLTADQLAVLEEYYAIDEPARRSNGAHAWTADPAHVPVIRELRVAATDRGERTLLVEGAPPMELWRFVDDATPSVLLSVDR